MVVVGAGLSGLSSALHLLGAGFKVTLLEREDVPGGRNGIIEREGFRFDPGPTVFTMVPLLDEAFAAVGKRRADYVSMKLLDPAYHASFADGSRLLVRPGHEAMREEILAECGPADASAFDEFVTWLRRLNDVELPNFIDVNLSSPLDLLRSPGAAAQLVRLGGFNRLGPEIARRFKDERLHRVFSFQAMYAGLAPSQALALYAVITYMDSIAGVWFPEGGMHAVPRAMAAAAQEAGAKLRLGCEVERVLLDDASVARGVQLVGGERVLADAVVVTADLPVAYEKLLPGLKAPRAATRGRYSPSCVVWHLGVRGTLPEQAGHHNIHFGRAWDEAFNDLLNRGRPMSDPSRFVAIPSLDDPTAVPTSVDGQQAAHTMYVLEPVPNLQVGRVDWESEAAPLTDRMLAFLRDAGYPTEIVTQQVVAPLDWQAQGMAAGTPFALAHTFRQSGPFRPRNFDKRVPRLVFAGSGTHPGVGIPMVLISGKLAAERVKRGLR